MDDEIRIFAEGRPSAPPYSPQERERARERLLEEARGRRGFRLPRFGWQAAAAFGVTVALVGGVAVALTGRQGVTGPGATVSVVQATLPGELNPLPGQFIAIESETMYTTESVGAGGKSAHWLYRTHRKIWRSVDGSKDGLLMIQSLADRPWPGETQLPAEASKGDGEPSWMQLAACPATNGTDYANLSKLPADAAAMKAGLYADGGGDKQIPVDEVAFTKAGDTLRETYLPRAQRDALFEAIKQIPGVQVAEGVEDSAGRKGVALGRVERGLLDQLVFDPESHVLLGERSTVVDAAVAGAPAGSVLALTAQTGFSVVDTLPEAAKVDADSSCDPQLDATLMPTPIPTDASATFAPTPTRAVPGEPTPTATEPANANTGAPTSVPTDAVPTEAMPTESPTKPQPSDASIEEPTDRLSIDATPPTRR